LAPQQIKTELNSIIHKDLAAAIKADIDKAVRGRDETGLVHEITERGKALALFAANRALGGDVKKTRINNPDLMDARVAGKAGCEAASLFIAEGPSAMTMCAVSLAAHNPTPIRTDVTQDGFAVVGSEFNGCIPLRGKINNIHDQPLGDVLSKMPAIAAILKALGLRPGSRPGDDTLRYGRVILMTDQVGRRTATSPASLTPCCRTFMARTFPACCSTYSSPIGPRWCRRGLSGSLSRPSSRRPRGARCTPFSTRIPFCAGRDSR